jgi:hypothetical protein
VWIVLPGFVPKENPERGDWKADKQIHEIDPRRSADEEPDCAANGQYIVDTNFAGTIIHHLI